MKQALVVIDVQNDYFPEGQFPLWNAEEVLKANLEAIEAAKQQGIPILLVQHVAQCAAPFFRAETSGVEIHPKILAAAPGAPIIVKHHADSFHQTDLQQHLQKLGSEELLLTGMMTHNCITHTALSPQAPNYGLKVIAPATTTVNETLHALALHALSVRVQLVDSLNSN